MRSASVPTVRSITRVVGGWTSAEFRAFYLFGAVLNVPWLALGSITVNARAPIVSRVTGGVLVVVALLFARGIAGGGETALWLPGLVLATVWGILLVVGVRGVVIAGSAVTLVVYSALGTVAVVTGDYQQVLPATGLPEGSELFLPAVRGYAVGANAVGAITVIVGALASSAAMVWRRPDREADHDLAVQARRGAPVEALARWVFRGRTGAPVAHLVRGNLFIALGVLLLVGLATAPFINWRRVFDRTRLIGSANQGVTLDAAALAPYVNVKLASVKQLDGVVVLELTRGEKWDAAKPSATDEPLPAGRKGRSMVARGPESLKQPSGTRAADSGGSRRAGRSGARARRSCCRRTGTGRGRDRPGQYSSPRSLGRGAAYPVA